MALVRVSVLANALVVDGNCVECGIAFEVADSRFCTDGTSTHRWGQRSGDRIDVEVGRAFNLLREAPRRDGGRPRTFDEMEAADAEFEAERQAKIKQTEDYLRRARL